MKIVFALISCVAMLAGLVSCVDVPGGSYPYGYGGSHYGSGSHYGGGSHYGSGGYYGGGGGYYGGGYPRQPDYVIVEKERQHETHCYCSHKSCGCKPGHPKGGCYCDKGVHRH